MAIATTSASTSTNISLTRSVGVPSAAARSSCTESDSSGRHTKTSAAKADAPPM